MDNTNNLNLFQNKTFSLIVERSPFVNYFCTHVGIPDINSTSATQPNPFTVVKVPGDHLDYSPLTATFNVDEDLRNYEEIVKWMQEYAFPENFDQYRNSSVPVNQQAASKLSDIYVQTYTNHYNPNIQFVFEGAYPINISGLDLNTQVSDTPILTCTVTFDYTIFRIERKKVLEK